MTGFFVVIVAGGVGTRFARNLPKQFCCIDGEVVIKKVVKLFLDNKKIDGIVCVIPQNYLGLYESIFKNYSEYAAENYDKYVAKNDNKEKLFAPVFGGDTRQESVFCGLQAIVHLNPDYVLIHDVARHQISSVIVNNVVSALEAGSRAVVPAILPVDSVRYRKKVVEKSDVFLVQTPQGFDFDLIYRLHKKYYNFNSCDDSMLCDLDGIYVDIVEGDVTNTKMTFDDKNRPAIKIGFGFDAHAFSSDSERKLYLMGVFVERMRGLEAVSDGDVGIHSLVDAILGASGQGSIGEVFPGNDAINSRYFLQYCSEMLVEKGYRIINIDSTIVCEEPKISSFVLDMKKVIGNILHLDVDAISIKGKTTEKMGYQGRKEGISAYSVVLLSER